MRSTIFPFRAAIIFFASFLLATTISVNAQSDDYTAVFRLYNQQNQRHIYTRACDEKNSLAQSGFTFDNVAFYVATQQKRRTVPLHRLLLSNGGHLYTTSDEEMRSLTANPANRYEAVVGYVASTPQKNTVPLYRLINGDRHFLTSSEQEKNNYMQTIGSRLEGIAAYVWTSGLNPCDGNQPVPSGNFPVIYAQANLQGPAEAIERDYCRAQRLGRQSASNSLDSSSAGLVSRALFKARL